MIYQETKKALGTDCLITLNTPDSILAKKTFIYLWKEIEDFENRFSRFKSSSELSKTNINAGNKTKISKEFKNILIECIKYSNLTDGLYNPFILPALQSAGYKGSWPNPNIFNPDLDYSDRFIKDISELKISGEYLTIPSDSALDLGGMGKGYLLKELTREIKNKFSGYWISLGGDILADGVNINDQPWNIFISDPKNENNVSIVSNNKKFIAVATSGSVRRSGAGWNHLIDPRNGLSSVSNFLSASVVCDDPLKADILASCFLLLKTNEILKFADKFKVDVLLQKDFITSSSRNIMYLGNRSTFNP